MNESEVSMLEPVDMEVVPYILKNWLRSEKQWRKTKPFHSLRSCEEVASCLVHAKRGNR